MFEYFVSRTDRIRRQDRNHVQLTLLDAENTQDNDPGDGPVTRRLDRPPADAYTPLWETYDQDT